MGTCMICDFECDDLAQFQRHVCEHSPLTPAQFTPHAAFVEKGGSLFKSVVVGDASRKHRKGQGLLVLEQATTSNKEERGKHGRPCRGLQQQGVDHHDLNHGQTLVAEQLGDREIAGCVWCTIIPPAGSYFAKVTQEEGVKVAKTE